MNKRAKQPRCTRCGRAMVRVDQANINHLLASISDRHWRYLLGSPDLLLLTNSAIQMNDARALRDVLGLLSLRMRVQSVAA